MPQLHNNFNDEQVKQLFKWYVDGVMSRSDLLIQLGIKNSRFYALLARYKADPGQFSISYGRDYANRRLEPSIIQAIRKELESEKSFIDNPAMPIMFYNYAAVRDTVEDLTGKRVAAQTVINYAKQWGYYLERPRNKAHIREVITESIGMLLQHDASIHQWTPYAPINPSTHKPVKWSLITTLDDHSRKILYAELFEKESAWAHILALESVILNYGVGVQYYSDNHAIFRFVANRERNYQSAANYERILGTDDVAPQWKQCVEATGMRVAYALSPEAKGKIERPYRWLQDRIVRRSARERAVTIDDVRKILRHEIDRYNNRQVHSTTKEIPSKRFTKALREGRSCFRPLDMSKLNPPVESTKDLFCLRTERKVDGYGQISFQGIKLKVPKGLPDGTTIRLHIVPGKQITEIRMLKNNTVLSYLQIQTPRQFQF